MFFGGRSKERGEPGHGARDSPETVLFDKATGLHKTWHFERRVHEEVQRCARYARGLALILWEPRLLPREVMDNDVIARVGAVIKAGLRQTDMASLLVRPSASL